MSAPMIPVPDPQKRAFDLAMAERLGVDPGQVTEAGFSFKTGPDDEALITWSGIAVLPTDEVLAMFNGASNPTEVITRYAVGDQIRCPTCGKFITDIDSGTFVGQFTWPCGHSVTAFRRDDDPLGVWVGPGRP